jgi:hypothetical protein
MPAKNNAFFDHLAADVFFEKDPLMRATPPPIPINAVINLLYSQNITAKLSGSGTPSA